MEKTFTLGGNGQGKKKRQVLASHPARQNLAFGEVRPAESTLRLLQQAASVMMIEVW